MNTLRLGAARSDFSSAPFAEFNRTYHARFCRGVSRIYSIDMAHEYGHFVWRNLENCLISLNNHASPVCDRKNASSSMREYTSFEPFVARSLGKQVTVRRG